MKILIGYNGSQTAEAALDDLRQAGLPDEAEVIILTVAEVCLPPQNTEEAGVFARRAQERLRKEFPFWKITAEITYGSPAQEILAKAEDFKPDLIVVGDQCRSLSKGSTFLRRTSHKIMDEAKCSVRITRGKIDADKKTSRIIIGFDGSDGAWKAVEEAASRNWKQKSEVHLVVVSDSTVPSSIGRFVAPVSSLFDEVKIVRRQMEKLAEAPLQKLKNAGLSATLSVGAGNPKEVLLELAERWNADLIFVGPNSLSNSFARNLLGSVSASVAASAECSVEVVRKTRN
jgi:nucleotide-binding universal stress UspA family protein